MAGSIFYNWWAALAAFTIYFFCNLQSGDTPTQILIQTFIIALVVFVASFLVRYLIAFVMYTPTEIEQEENPSDEHIEVNEDMEKANLEVNTESQAEELAKAVKTMMAQDE
ncbi:hypothetical protein [Rummeliibacillus sp. BSL5]